MDIGLLTGVIAKQTAETFELDFSVKSLEEVDSMLDDAKNWKQKTKDMLVIATGCYIGGILIRETGGRWCNEEEYTPPLSNAWIEIPSKSGTVTANPFVRCQKRIRNGKADGVAVWTKFLVAMDKTPTKVAEVGQKS